MSNPLAPKREKPISPESNHKNVREPDSQHEKSPTLAARASRVATVVLVLNVVFFTGFVLAWMLGWISLSTGTSKAGETQIVLSLSPSEMSADVSRSVDEMGKATESLVTATEQQSAQGKIVAIDVEGMSITLLSQEEERLSIAVTDITDVEVAGDESKFSDLSEGRSARIIYKENEGKLFALTVKQFESGTPTSES